jgi:hypothetical protein
MNLEYYARQLVTIRKEILVQQYRTAEGYHDSCDAHLNIEDAASSLEEAAGHLMVAIGKIDHHHEMQAPDDRRRLLGLRLPERENPDRELV